MKEKKEDLRSEIVVLKQIVYNKNKDIEVLKQCNETRMEELEELKEQLERLRHTLRESEEYERRLLYTIEELKERLHEGEQKTEYVQDPDIERETRITEYETDYIMVDAVYPNGTDIRFHIPINAYKDE